MRRRSRQSPQRESRATSPLGSVSCGWHAVLLDQSLVPAASLQPSASLDFAQTTPYPQGLIVLECPLQPLIAHPAHPADRLGLTRHLDCLRRFAARNEEIRVLVLAL